MFRVQPHVNRLLGLATITGLAILLLLIFATAAMGFQGGMWLPGQQASEGVDVERVQAVPTFHRQMTAAAVVRTPPPRPASAPTGSPWDCIAKYESGNRPLPCAPYCGRLQWLPSTWRAAGGTRYAPLPQQATYEQEKQIASEWLKRTSWAQWPSTSRRCGYR